MIYRFHWLAAGLMLLWQQGAMAQPVEITSDSVHVMPLKNQAVFKTGVHLVREAFHLRCDQLTAYYVDGELTRAEAKGRVRMQQHEKKGAADQAVYTAKDHVLIMVGQASVENDQGVVRGEKVIYRIDTEQTEVISSQEAPRVRMQIDMPEGK